MKTTKLSNIRLLTLYVMIIIAAGCERKELYTHEEIYTGSVRLSLEASRPIPFFRYPPAETDMDAGNE